MIEEIWIGTIFGMLVVRLVGWLVSCNAGDSFDVTLAFKDAQVIPTGWDDG